MPCCCKDNVQACFVLGIVSGVLSLLLCLDGYKSHIIYGIFGTLVSGILIFGAKQRNPTAILVWMVFTIIGVIGLIVLSLLAIFAVLVVSSNPHIDELNLPMMDTE